MSFNRRDEKKHIDEKADKFQLRHFGIIQCGVQHKQTTHFVFRSIFVNSKREIQTMQSNIFCDAINCVCSISSLDFLFASGLFFAFRKSQCTHKYVVFLRVSTSKQTWIKRFSNSDNETQATHAQTYKNSHTNTYHTHTPNQNKTNHTRQTHEHTQHQRRDAMRNESRAHCHTSLQFSLNRCSWNERRWRAQRNNTKKNHQPEESIRLKQ